jgi:prolyl-tRNA synthetase
LIGGMIMTHSDDKGLVLPPRLATTHVAIVPILSNAGARATVLEASEKLQKEIQTAGKSSSLPYELGILLDRDENKQAGWKFHEYELLGIPVRIELGPRDLEKGQVVLTRRDTGQKEFVALSDVPQKVVKTLDLMQKELLEKARDFREKSTFRVESYPEFKAKLDAPGGFLIAPWCESKVCEAKVKEETKATIRCLPLDADFNKIPEGASCIFCENKAPTVRAIFARSY